jgi:hypothetical protein
MQNLRINLLLFATIWFMDFSETMQIVLRYDWNSGKSAWEGKLLKIVYVFKLIMT